MNRYLTNVKDIPRRLILVWAAQEEDGHRRQFTAESRAGTARGARG